MTPDELKHLKDTLTPSDLAQILWTRLSDRPPTAEDSNHWGDVEWSREGTGEILEGSWTMYRKFSTMETSVFWRPIVYPTNAEPS